MDQGHPWLVLGMRLQHCGQRVSLCIVLADARKKKRPFRMAKNRFFWPGEGYTSWDAPQAVIGHTARPLRVIAPYGVPERRVSPAQGHAYPDTPEASRRRCRAASWAVAPRRAVIRSM
jgi:hypothetical protein